MQTESRRRPASRILKPKFSRFAIVAFCALAHSTHSPARSIAGEHAITHPTSDMPANFRYSTAQGVGDHPFWADFTVSIFAFLSCLQDYLLDVVYPGRLHRFDGSVHLRRADPSSVPVHLSAFTPLRKRMEKRKKETLGNDSPLSLCSHNCLPICQGC